MKQKTHTRERGIALLITLLIMTVLLGVSASLLNITLKQLQFSSIGLASEMAFQAANAGMECMLFHDYQGYPASSKFDIGAPLPSISCMDRAPFDAPSELSDTNWASREYRFEWGNPAVCVETEIFKFFDSAVSVDMSNALRRTGTCARGVSCTVIQSRGYNVACGALSTPRTIERELTQRY